MEYRLNRRTGDKISIIGLGTSAISDNGIDEGVRILEKAYENGVNYFDLAGGKGELFEVFGKVFSGEDKVKDSVEGPLGIAQIYGGTWQWSRFWYITGLLSLILAFMNVLPILGLDGGHALFCLA